ncbi:Abi family protein [Alloscardovia macacae]|nr:Abi family protein [Alloscardovia macacae]
MIIANSKTGEILQREGYYSIINGYKTPFLESPHADTFVNGTTFDHLYQLFTFDRDLRCLIFSAIIRAEAFLRTSCAYCFTEYHQNEPNAYLRAEHYNSSMSHQVSLLLHELKKIIQNNSSPESVGNRTKPYIRHCIEMHNGEVPLWVLSNDLTLGQMFWFFQTQKPEVRGAVAQLYTHVYNSSHKIHRTISAKKLDSIYRRIKEFRNICAHDERLYCARPHNNNATVFQLIKDLALVIPKSEYLELLKKIEILLHKIESGVPTHSREIIQAMGIPNMDDYLWWQEIARESKKYRQYLLDQKSKE